MPGQTPLISEILENISKAKTDDEKVFLLQQQGDFTIKTLMQCAFSPNLNFDLPATDPPYKVDDSPEGLSVTSLRREVRKFVYFVPGHPNHVENQIKREQIFIEMLEGLHDSEAKLVLSVKAKKMPGISHEVAHRAFPNVVPAPIVEEKPPSAPKKKATRRKTKN